MDFCFMPKIDNWPRRFFKKNIRIYILYVKLLVVKNEDMRIDDQNDMMVANPNMP